MHKTGSMIILVMVVFIAIIGSGGCVEDLETNDMVSATPTPVKQITFEERLVSEVATTCKPMGITLERVVYNKDKKDLVIYIRDDTSPTVNMMRKSFAYTTYDIMNVVVKYPDRIDTVTIVGRALMQDTKGNRFYDTVYQAKTTMSDARTVNWVNMKTFKDPVAALDYNLEVRWHGSIRP